MTGIIAVTDHGSTPASLNEAPTSHKRFTIDEAISITGRSWFHVALLLITGWCTGAVAVEILCPAYLIPSQAACDLGMTKYDKGLLGSISFAGMVSGAQFWGVTADLKGRCSVLRFVMICNGCLGIVASMLPTLHWFLAARYFTGLFIASGTACSATLLGEFHEETYRARAIMRLSVFPGTAAFITGGFAYLILLKSWTVPLPWVTFTPWRLYVMYSSLPCLIGGLTLLWFPESPRFLATRGRHDEALAVLSRVWSYSSKRPPCEFPVKALHISPLPKTTVLKTLNNQISPLFRKPFLKNTLLLCFSICSVVACVNGLMVWFPEVFNRMAQYAALNPGEDVTACRAVEYMIHRERNKTMYATRAIERFSRSANFEEVMPLTNRREDCVTNLNPEAFYRPAIISFFDATVPIVGTIVVRWVGNKRLFNFAILAGSILVIGLLWVQGSNSVLALSCAVSSITSMCITLSMGISVDIYPTHLRAFGSSTAILAGRFGALCGSLLVGALLQLYCPAVFWSLSGLLLVAGCLSLLLPHKKK